jgi:hypothetical protein
MPSSFQAIEWTSEYQQPGPKYGHVQVAVSQAGDNLCELVQCVSELSALAGNPQFTAQVLSLVEALCEAFTNFLGKSLEDSANFFKCHCSQIASGCSRETVELLDGSQPCRRVCLRAAERAERGGGCGGGPTILRGAERGHPGGGKFNGDPRSPVRDFD